MSVSYNNSDQSGGDKTTPAENDDVPQLDSRDVVLRFLNKHDYPHRTKQIYGGLLYSQVITFGYRAVQEAVSDLHEEGLIRKVYVDSDAGEVLDIDDQNKRRGSYVITDAGRKYAETIDA